MTNIKWVRGVDHDDTNKALYKKTVDYYELKEGEGL